MIRIYSVLDADGVKINTITADEDLVNSGWWPGYGAALVDEGENPADPPPAPPPVKPVSWRVIPKLKDGLTNGDKLDLKTGEVTRAELIADVL
jgi:hypothetical protein